MADALIAALQGVEDPEAIRKILSKFDVTEHIDNEAKGNEDWYQSYLNRRSNRSPATIAQYRRTLPSFIDFLDSRSVTQPSALVSDDIDDYFDHLMETYDSDSTVLTYTKNVRAWLSFLAKRDKCDSNLVQLLDRKELGLSPTVRDETIPQREAACILRNLRRERRGTKHHSIMAYAWNAGPRIGGIHSNDIPDFDPTNHIIRFRHRPEEGTRLKNGSADDDTPGDGERTITLSPETVDAICYYIEHNRPAVIDDFKRHPLFATEHGRASRSTLRRWIYHATSCRFNTISDIPCDGSCNPDTDPCPRSYSPHAVRRGAIVAHLSGDLGLDKASERFNSNPQTLKKHYDPRSEVRRMEDRLENVRQSWETIGT